MPLRGVNFLISKGRFLISVVDDNQPLVSKPHANPVEEETVNKFVSDEKEAAFMTPLRIGSGGLMVDFFP